MNRERWNAPDEPTPAVMKAKKREEEKKERKEIEIGCRVFKRNYDHLKIERKDFETDEEYGHRVTLAMDLEWDRCVNYMMAMDKKKRRGENKK